MHTMIGILVQAEDSSLAVSEAEAVLAGLTETDGAPFDYGNAEIAHSLATDAGKKCVADLMAQTKLEFTEAIGRVRSFLLDHSDNGAVYEMPPSSERMLFEFHCRNLSRQPGPEVHLYDWAGNTVTTAASLRLALEKSNLWVVLVDVHT